MDTLTHALSGTLLARAGAPRTRREGDPPLWQRLTVGTLACGFPDIDIVASAVSPLTYLVNHRGITHSLVAMPLWALLLAVVFAKLFRAPRGWRAFIGVAAMGVSLHIAGDLITTFGTIVFAPFSNARFAWGTTFIIDLWFSGIIVAGLIASLVWRASRVPAVAACVVLVAYVGFQYAMQHRAAAFGREYAKAQGLAEARVSALPRALSPFNWTVVVTTHDAQRYAHINLVRKEAPAEAAPDAGLFRRIDASYFPTAQARWQRAPRLGNSPEEARLAFEAWNHPDFAFFRWFSEYPALLRTERQGATTCVWFHDLRFANPGVTYTPFRFGMCRERGQPWQRFELLASGQRVRYD